MIVRCVLSNFVSHASQSQPNLVSVMSHLMSHLSQPPKYSASVATVMTNVFQKKNEIYMPRELVKILEIFEKIDGAHDRGVI